MFVLAIGGYLPPTRANTDHVGGKGTPDNMWPVRCVAGPDDHPANMSARALQAALANAGVDPRELALVVYTGRARDYLASWSVATEVMALVGAPASCVGLDLALGCATLPAALPLARGWLTVPGRKYVAIVDAERWSVSIDRTDPASERMWAYGDGAAAMIVAATPSGHTPLAEWIGSSFATHAAYNSSLIPEFGGTVRPYAESAELQLRLRLDSTPPMDMFGIQSQLYEDALADLRVQTGFTAVDHVVCSQLSPAWVERMVMRLHRPRPASIVNTGRCTGHLGGVDLFLGLDALARAGQLRGTIIAAGTAPYATALALFRA
jgi:3-oxoacyl-[acyl-carrier-protein] synthase III